MTDVDAEGEQRTRRRPGWRPVVGGLLCLVWATWPFLALLSVPTLAPALVEPGPVPWRDVAPALAPAAVVAVLAPVGTLLVARHVPRLRRIAVVQLLVPFFVAALVLLG